MPGRNEHGKSVVERTFGVDSKNIQVLTLSKYLGEIPVFIYIGEVIFEGVK